jgi:hypothetical protein
MVLVLPPIIALFTEINTLTEQAFEYLHKDLLSTRRALPLMGLMILDKKYFFLF